MSIDAETIQRVIRYEPETGKLFWVARPVELFHVASAANRWNTRYAGREALTAIDRHGYRLGSLLGKRQFAHRVAWVVAHGRWPVDIIDHANGVRDDNRLCNLREATQAENVRNSRSHRDSTSKYVGVSRTKQNRWQANISLNRTTTYLGTFGCEVEAARAYDAAALHLHGAFARINFPKSREMF